ncbi:hypothetical protein [Cohnella cellulosilytica]|uniref:DUF4175 domain-containing protein n=1 Tax=Cohnella cellulosilytica TaxID=986710 RepID=A0ABW2FIX6_9BACL
MNIQRNPKKWEERSMGLVILGWSLVVVGVVIASWGFFEVPASSWRETEFLAFAIGGMAFIAGGLAFLKVPGWLIVIAIMIAALLLILFIWKSQLDWGSALLCYVTVAALAAWLVRLALK